MTTAVIMIKSNSKGSNNENGTSTFGDGKSKPVNGCLKSFSVSVGDKIAPSFHYLSYLALFSIVSLPLPSLSLSLPNFSSSQALSVSLSSALLSSSFSFISVSPPPLSHSVSLSLLPQSALLSVWVALLNAAAERIARSCILPSHRKKTGHIFPLFSPQMDV